MKNTSVYLFATATLMAACLYAQQSFSGPAQAGRGFELFTRTAKPQACINCHAIGGNTQTAAPNLKMWSKMAPRATAMAISTSLTEKAVWVESKQGDFPAMKVSEEGDSVKFFDLSKTPPEVRTVAKADVKSAKSNTTWKHPPGAAKLTPAELADVIAYIRWEGARDKTPVSPDSVE